MDEKMNLRIISYDFSLLLITKYHAADSKIGSPLKIDLRADWTRESNPTVWEFTLRACQTKKKLSLTTKQVEQNVPSP